MEDAHPVVPALVERRIHSLLRAAHGRSAGMDLAEIALLMPAEGPDSPPALGEWFARTPGLGILKDGRVYLDRSSENDARRRDESLRATAYVGAARQLMESALRPIRPLMASVLVTGSTAYGTPRPGDDCDLFIVARPGALWCVLAFTFLRLRTLRPTPGHEAPGSWCLNYVVDPDAAWDDFRSPRGFLFAREALTAIPLLGASAYRSVLASAPWLRAEAPRLYDRWELPGAPSERPRRAALPVRILNALLFPVLGAYLQAVGLFRNWRLRRQGRSDDQFRTRTEPGRYVIRSVKFDRLQRIYRGSSVLEQPGVA